MNLNIHPIFVHFPIALLTIYSLMELIRFKKVMQQQYWFYLKAVFVMLGGLGALAAYQTGGLAAGPLRHDPYLGPVLRLHSSYAKLVIAIYGLLAASYLITWVQQYDFFKDWQFFLWRAAVAIKNFFLKPWVSIIMAVVGLLAVTITGALGGMLVYGFNIDPVVQLVYKFIVK